MRKQAAFFVIMAAVCMAGAGNSAQGRDMGPRFGGQDSPHHFGVGISSGMFDAIPAFNQYIPLSHLSGNVMLYTAESSSFAISVDYRFRLDERWSVGARLKYSHRSNMYRIGFTTPGTSGIGHIGEIYSSYGDLQLPITWGWRFAGGDGAAAELLFGTGIATAGLVANDAPRFGFADGTKATLHMEHKNGIDVFGTVGVQAEVPFGKVSIRPFLMLTCSPLSTARYVITPEQSTPTLPQELHTSYKRLLELECGVMLQL